MTLEERYTRALHLAGYERVAPDTDIYTVAFKNKDTLDMVQADGWEMLGEEMEKIQSVIETEEVEQLVHPKNRLCFYCKNLGGTGLEKDLECVIYQDLQEAVKAYLSAEVDGKILGYKIEDKEEVITYFNVVDMKNHYTKGTQRGFFDDITVNEKQEVMAALEILSDILDKNNMYYSIHEGISIVMGKCVADISAGKTEWGAWMGRVANLHRPQDYVDIDITGYSTRNEVICNINTIHANEIVSMKQVVVKSVPEELTKSIRDGLAEAMKEIEMYISRAIEDLATDTTYPMQFYSPYTMHELSDHYRLLEDAGYAMFPSTHKEPMQMDREEMQGFIHNFFREYDEKLICTKHVLNALAVTVLNMIESGQISGTESELKKLLVKESVINFIKERFPMIEEVPQIVQESITRYFHEHFEHFTPTEVCRKSNHPEDAALYAVIAQHDNGQYACWTSWHQDRESMNYGHYSLPDRDTAFAIIKENFNDISSEMEKYGPEKTITPITEPAGKEQTQTNVIAYTHKTRGR